MEQQGILQEAKYNAGLVIAMQLANEVAEASYYSKREDFQSWNKNLEVIERRMFPKFRTNKKAYDEIINLKEKYKESWFLFNKKLNKGKKVPPHIFNQARQFLIEFEKILLFYRDKFGYGMPSRDNPSFALGGSQ